jgi:hypothetical protein
MQGWRDRLQQHSLQMAAVVLASRQNGAFVIDCQPE